MDVSKKLQLAETNVMATRVTNSKHKSNIRAILARQPIVRHGN